MSQPKKIIIVTGCNTNCPLRNTCQVWKKLTPNQRISLTIGVNIPHDFILKDCPLEDAEPQEKE